MKQIKEKVRMDVRKKYAEDFLPWVGKDCSAQHRFINLDDSVIMSFTGDPVLQSFDEGKTWQWHKSQFNWPREATSMYWVKGELLAFQGGYALWRSDNGGKTWGAKEEIRGPDEIFKGLGRPNIFSIIVTQRFGTIVMVADCWLGQEGPDGQLLCSITSDDAGRTWKTSRLFGPPSPLPGGPEGFGEPAVVEMKNSWLWMVFRTLYGELWQSISRDQGRTWGDATPTGLASPIANCYAARDPYTAATVLCFNLTKPGLGQNFRSVESVYRPRNNLVFMVSHDNCRTWTCPVVVDPGGAFYPTIHFTEKTMFIMYQSNKDETEPWADHGLTLVTYDREEVDALPAWTAKTIQPYIEAGLVRHWLALACHRPTKEAIENWIS